MDLRQFNPSRERVEEAARLLRYQPFILDDDRHTGVAHTWLHSPDPTAVTADDFFFDKRIVSRETWDEACDANRRLATMYDAFIDRIVDVCPREGSYLDVACNTGYFPVRASLAGIRTAAGIDLGDFSEAFQLLNEITGSAARFAIGGYDSAAHTLTLPRDLGLFSYDVVSSSAFLCHLPDPLHFLKAMADIARKAIFVWSGFVDSEELMVRYNAPNRFSSTEFPNGFDNGTSISTGLLFLAMSSMGFAHREEIHPTSEWLPEDWHLRRMPQYQKFRAFLFWR